MTNKRITNILKKEWLVLSKDVNSLMLATVLPLLILGEAMVVIWLVDRFGGGAILSNNFFLNSLAKMREALPAVAGLSLDDQLKVFLLRQIIFYLLLIPTMIAVSFATFSIVDEKLSGSLEALLATPVRTWELLVGKALAGAIPALIMTWLCAGIFIGVVIGVGWGQLLGMVLTPSWFIALLLMTPLIALLSFMLGVIGSSRAKDARSAQTLSVLIILPMFALIALQVTGLVWFTTISSIILVIVLALVDFLVVRLAVSLFQRESIVIKWR